MELDLNQESLDQIEERIRRLEAVISRARQRQRQRQGQTPIQITNFTAESVTTANDVQDEGRVHQEEVGTDVEGGVEEGMKLGKTKGSDLVAKALGVETYTNEAEGCTGNFYDCNICLDMARDPVLTCCGHLFCWPCFYNLSYAYSNAKECPVCKGEVTETGIIPIYGNASVISSGKLELKEASLRVPDRPRALRIESIRQQRRSPRATPFHEMMRVSYLLRNLGVLESPSATSNRPNDFAAQSRQEAENSQHTSSHQFSRLPMQEAASLSSDSAVDHSELLSREFETFPMRLISDSRYSPFSIAATYQPGNPNGDVAATYSATPSFVSPISSNDNFNTVSDTDTQTTDSSIMIISTDPSSSTGTDLLR